MPGPPRFLTLADVAEVLNTSSAQVYALVRRGDLVAIRAHQPGETLTFTLTRGGQARKLEITLDSEVG